MYICGWVHCEVQVAVQEPEWFQSSTPELRDDILKHLDGRTNEDKVFKELKQQFSIPSEDAQALLDWYFGNDVIVCLFFCL